MEAAYRSINTQVHSPCDQMPRLMEERAVPAGGPISCLLINAVVAFINLAKLGAKLLTARKTTTYVDVLASHPCDGAAC